MKALFIPCGPTANESERKAIEHLKARVQDAPGSEEWIFLTNIAFSVTDRMQSDEIDIIAIGPPGVRVIEVKHWNAEIVKARGYDLEREADLVTSKARKIGTTLRKQFRGLPRVDGVFLLTQDPPKIKRLVGQAVRGVTFYGLSDWKEVIGGTGAPTLPPEQAKRLSQCLEPRSRLSLEGSLRRFAGYVNLELQSGREDRFHRVYRGSHPARRDRAVLHLYDLSASDDKNAATRARREFDALHRLQLHPWAPRILDSFQDAPGYPGEMSFFTVVDPAAPSIAVRKDDVTWSVPDRAEFVSGAIRALAEMHQAKADGEQLTHRNLSPANILVRHDNAPIFTGFDRTKISSEISVAAGYQLPDKAAEFAAPEVVAGGLGAADVRSDVFSVCASLATIFDGTHGEMCEKAIDILAGGTVNDPPTRPSLEYLHAEFGRLLGKTHPRPAAPPSRYWTEGQLVTFHDRDYRILNTLGTGGVGAAFKVVEVDRSTKEDLGTYVAKVVRDAAMGTQTLRAYGLARSHLGRHTGLSAIFEVANDWQENGFVSLMAWVEGTPLAEFRGVMTLLADDLQERNSVELAIRWIKSVCNSLAVLHRNGLVHGDVSPQNLIVSGNDLVLTDFDFVTKVGEKCHGAGTALYSALKPNGERLGTPSDDIYALAATFFHVTYDREPFRYDGSYDKHRGLNWEGLAHGDDKLLDIFLQRATDPDPTRRFSSVDDVNAFLRDTAPAASAAPTPHPAGAQGAVTAQIVPAVKIGERHVEWLGNVLRSYPGSPTGNQETRGLDSPFAASTYVETTLEQTLISDMKSRKSRLVVLCGNAGDGKTSLLQHIAQRLGLGKHTSADRILKGKLPDGLVIKMNLDGSAAWKGKSADDLLDEFLGPFQNGFPSQDVAHLLAVNDGRLLEWTEGYEGRHSGQSTPLTEALFRLLQPDAADRVGHIRFVNLNQRTLVGDVSADSLRITTDFLDRLLDQLYGGSDTAETWMPCSTCSAQSRCEVFRAGQLFAPEGFPTKLSAEARKRARERLAESLQAVHLRGETHITVRELRAALVYILFGVHFCTFYHSEKGASTPGYWDRAFEAESPSRQGEVLRELVRLDPALEAHPQIDRYLTSEPIADSLPSAPRYPNLALASGRRRAFFEWSAAEIKQIAGDPDALDIACGRHMRKFRDLPLFDNARLQAICRDLCKGISRLEDLPPRALERDNVPLRITPRTPTETAFWVEKPLSSFRLNASLPQPTDGIERLHRQALLIYRCSDGREEHLRLGAELFHLLLELADGYQLGDVSTDDTFANLSIFVQRLVQEDAGELLAWNPMADDSIFRVRAEQRLVGSEGTRQCLTIVPALNGVCE